jgi:phospholipid/cholesterol/gamma-HCH transport system permease protein
MAATTAPTPAPAPAEAPPAVANGMAVGLLREAGELTKFSFQSIAALAGVPRYMSEVLRQASIMIRGSSVFVFFLSAFCGMSIVNFAYFFLRALGASDFLGLTSGYPGPRQVGTTLFGYAFTAKVCCGMTAEIGAMRINQEIDAYESTGVDPLKYVVGTRLAAVLIFAPIATFISLIAVLAGVYFDSVVLIHGIAPATLMQVNWSVQTITDQLFALVTMTTVAVSTTLVACFYGLRTRGGPDAVGSAVARSLVVNLVIVHIITAGFAAAFYGMNIRLPVGG